MQDGTCGFMHVPAKARAYMHATALLAPYGCQHACMHVRRHCSKEDQLGCSTHGFIPLVHGHMLAPLASQPAAALSTLFNAAARSAKAGVRMRGRTLPIADSTTQGKYWGNAHTMSATSRMRSASRTEEPPNL